MDSFRAMKEKVLATTLRAYGEGLFAGTSGNLSMCDDAKRFVAITPSGIRYETMKIDDIMVIDMDGSIVEGPHKPSSEWRMHTMILRQRPDIFAVVHTHSPYATSFAVTGTPVPPILIEMVGFLGGGIPVAGFELPGSAELGAGALRSLEHRHACLLSNHGVIAVGENIDQAFIRAEYVEDAAKIYSLSLQAGTPRLVPAEAIHAMEAKMGKL
jgi:L-ribulose-5-phosphate 4-epimerase